MLEVTGHDTNHRHSNEGKDNPLNKPENRQPETSQWPLMPAGIKPYYIDDSVCIICGDCREIVPGLGRFDLLLTDPPYEVHAGRGGGCFGNRDHLVNTGGFTDEGVNFAFLDGIPNWFCFCSRLQLPALLAVAQTAPRWNLLTWCKPNPVPTCNNKYLPDVEFIVHGFRSGRLFGDMSAKSCFMLHPCGNKETPHPNEKPLALVRKLVTLGTQPRETILDPFAGSGTTAVAAKSLGRKCVCIEREERYCEIAAKRCAQDYLQLTDSAPRDTAGDNKDQLELLKA